MNQTKTIETLREALCLMLDEIVWTRRARGTDLLNCAVCECDVSANEPHTPKCPVGKADAIYEASAPIPQPDEQRVREALERAKACVASYDDAAFNVVGAAQHCDCASLSIAQAVRENWNGAKHVIEMLDAALAQADTGAEKEDSARAEVERLREELKLLGSACDKFRANDLAMSSQLASLRAEADRLAEWAAEVIEHIYACDERHLLKCDDDPHPPSVFSVYADQGREILKALAAHPQQKGDAHGS